MSDERAPAASIDDELKQAQLEKLRLENKRLSGEFQRRPWYRNLGQFVPLVGPLIAIAGFWWGVMQYRDQEEKDRKAQSIQSQRESDAAERDFMKPWLQSQRDIYLQALSAASTIANTTDPRKRKEAEEEFWRLYHGKMIMVETTKVSDAMEAFGDMIKAREPRTGEEMNTLCRALATAMAESMAATGKMTYRQFESQRFRYTSDDLDFNPPANSATH